MENSGKKKQWALVAIVLVAVVGVIGGVFAYFTSSDTFENIFSTKPYSVKVTENFESPDKWTPGTTTAKTVIAENTGDVEVAVRVKLTPSWNNNLPLDYATNKPAAIINFASDLNTKWTKDGDYYYYKTKLGKHESTSSLITGVTFDAASVTGSEDKVHACTYTVSDAEEGTKTVLASDYNEHVDGPILSQTCTTTYGGYAGAIYTLNIDVETVQYDSYAEAWNTSVVIN